MYNNMVVIFLDVLAQRIGWALRKSSMSISSSMPSVHETGCVFIAP